MKESPGSGACILLLSVFFSLATLSASAYAVLDCTVCQPGSCPAGYSYIFSISEDSNAHLGPSDWDVRCNETGGSVSNTGAAASNVEFLRSTSLSNGHVERGDTHPNDYPYRINLSSNDVFLSCGYISAGDCPANGWQACVVSISNDTNAHVGDCGTYSLKVCCNSSLGDKEGPVCSISVPEWVNEPFEVSWSCNDPGGVKWYSVDYNRTRSIPELAWTSWLSDTLLTSSFFTPTSRNSTYYFRVNATDNFDNTGGYAHNYTTFDDEDPESELIGDNDGVNKIVNITSYAWDNISGVGVHTIDCTIIDSIGPPTVIKSCEPADPFGVSVCYVEIEYGDDTTITCTITISDRAGNSITDSYYFDASPDHPLVEFVQNSAFLSMGETYHTRVYVRNTKPGPDTVNVWLEGTYSPGLTRFLEAANLTAQAGNWNNITVDLAPYEQKVVYMEIVSGEGLGSYQLDLQAVSLNYPPLTDSDSMGLIIGFSAAFPGVEAFSIAIILLLSCIAYLRLGPGRK